MPAPTRSLALADIDRLVSEHCVHLGSAKRVGLEVEWIPVAVGDDRAHVSFSLVEQLATGAPRPAGSTLTFEPGGQVELSTPPLARVADAIEAVRTDAAALREALARAGIALRGIGLDPRPVRRVRDVPRYRAMEAFFDVDGFAGRRMMCATASVQVNLDLGTAETMSRRWRVAHLAGPVLAAVFANSPHAGGAVPGWRSARMANWWAMDPSRTMPVGDGIDPARAWAAYARNANVMLIRRSDEDFVPMTARMPFGAWMDGDHPLGYPTEPDLAYHLTTLFPPVRLRGWIEMRMIDALPDRWWPVAAAVTAALLDDEEASACVERVCAPPADAWLLAFRHGPSVEPLGTAARACFRAALDALPRLGVDARTREDAGVYYERYVARGRCPADDLLSPHEASLEPVTSEAG